MSNQDKTKEILLKELEELQQKYLSLEALYNKGLNELPLNQLVFVSLESASVGAWWIDFNEEDTYHALDNTARLIGVPISQLPDKSYRISDWINQLLKVQKKFPKYIPEVKKALEQFSGTISGKYEKYRAVYPVVMPDKKVKWIDARADISVRDKDGKALVMTGTLIDVTSMIEVGKELESHKNQLEELVTDRTNDLKKVSERLVLATRAGNLGIWDWNIPANELIWDNKMHELYGISHGEFSGAYEAWSQSIHPDDKMYVEEELEAACRGEIEFASEFRIIWPDGSIHYIKASAITFYSPDGKPIRMVGINYDITEQMEAERTLKENESRFRAFIEQSPVAIGLFNLEGKGMYSNQKFLETLGMQNMDEMIGRPAYEYFVPQFREESKERTQRRLLGLSVEPEFESVVLRSDGTEFPAQLAVAPIQFSNGIASIAFLFDVTERKRVEKELKQAKENAEESDRLKSAFLANMSHEIRTPMNGILGFAGLLKEPELSGEKQQEYISIIEKSGARMLNIINDIVSISKIESGTMDTNIHKTNINEQTDFVFNLLKIDAEKKNLNIIINKGLPDNESIINTDNEKFLSILSNLVKNAIKYTDKGSIEFGYKLIAAQNAGISPSLHFFVKDTGIGIPKDRQEAVFERFIQADIEDKMARQGVGLGLSISKAYVEMLGGKIWVESEEGNGSTFYFSIPYNVEPNQKNGIESNFPQDTDNDRKNLKILIAEDDKISEILISILTEKYSKENIVVRTGIDAIEACLNNPDIDLIFMDIQMNNLNGYEASRQIRQFNKEVIIIAQTAFAQSGDREKAIEAGCNDFISKPLIENELLKLIQKYFGK